MTDVLCAGHVNWDVTLRVAELPAPDGEVQLRGTAEAGGGSAANVAVNLAGLGATAAVFGSTGDDETGERARRELVASGVETHLVRADGETAVKYLIVDGNGEVMVLSGDGENEAFRAADLPPAALETDVCHLTSQAPSVAAGLTERARDHGATVSLAPGRRIADRDFSAALSRAALVFVNEREAAALGTEPWGDGLRPDAALVVTLGDDGAAVHTRDRTVEHPGFEATPLDTTGAGDAFAAGYLAARGGSLPDAVLAAARENVDDPGPRLPGDTAAGDDGVGVRAALAVANACGAVASRALGARAALTPQRLLDVIE
ncbi:carbohydrate kinase family protein [Halobaculum sp. MBLA0143]|uniref:carbohydrate kinase family protein n=1 Tax=Halobaculum sp. MBLA0143 TaxID=3079933 RepID=UPI003525721D